MEKKLRRTTGKQATLLGVCGGVANFLGIDATIVRILWAIAVIFYGTGIFFYILMAFIMPKE